MATLRELHQWLGIRINRGQFTANVLAHVSGELKAIIEAQNEETEPAEHVSASVADKLLGCISMGPDYAIRHAIETAARGLIMCGLPEPGVEGVNWPQGTRPDDTTVRAEAPAVDDVIVEDPAGTLSGEFRDRGDFGQAKFRHATWTDVFMWVGDQERQALRDRRADQLAQQPATVGQADALGRVAPTGPVLYRIVRNESVELPATFRGTVKLRRGPFGDKVYHFKQVTKLD